MINDFFPANKTNVSLGVNKMSSNEIKISTSVNKFSMGVNLMTMRVKI